MVTLVLDMFSFTKVGFGDMVPTKSFLGYEVQRDHTIAITIVVLLNVTGEPVWKVPNGCLCDLLYGRSGTARHVHVPNSGGAHD